MVAVSRLDLPIHNARMYCAVCVSRFVLLILVIQNPQHRRYSQNTTHTKLTTDKFRGNCARGIRKMRGNKQNKEWKSHSWFLGKPKLLSAVLVTVVSSRLSANQSPPRDYRAPNLIPKSIMRKLTSICLCTCIVNVAYHSVTHHLIVIKYD